MFKSYVIWSSFGNFYKYAFHVQYFGFVCHQFALVFFIILPMGRFLSFSISWKNSLVCYSFYSLLVLQKLFLKCPYLAFHDFSCFCSFSIFAYFPHLGLINSSSNQLFYSTICFLPTTFRFVEVTVFLTMFHISLTVFDFLQFGIRLPY